MENFNFDPTKLFGLTATDITSSKQSSNDSLMFNPSPEDGKPYIAQIRFIPYVFGNQISKVESTKYYAKNPLNDSKFYGYCPSSNNERSIFIAAFTMLKNSKSVKDQALMKCLANGKRFLSAILVIDDKNNPENNGKIMFWDFGVTIDKQIVGLLEPDFGKPCIVYDVLDGKDMYVRVSKNGGNNSYDGCKFSDERTPLVFDGNTYENTPEMQEKLKTWLFENTPKDDVRQKFLFQGWDDTTWNEALTYLDDLIPSVTMKETLWKKHGRDYQAWFNGDSTSTDGMTDTEKTIMESTTSTSTGTDVGNESEDSLMSQL